MDLIERYLAAIRHNLSRSRADDIVEELRGDLLDRLEAHEAKAGRPATEADVAGIVKDYGPPLVVAGRYQEHQYLIGPDAFPYYLYALRVAFVIVLVVFFFSGILPALIARGDAFKALLHGVGNAWYAIFVTFTIMTLFFAVAERAGMTRQRAAMWDPARLPDYEVRRKGRWESPFEVGTGILLLLFWTGIIPVQTRYTMGGVHFEPASVWSSFYWPILSFGVASLILNLITWLRPNWKAARLALGTATGLGGIWMVGALRASGPWVVTSSAGETAANAARAAAGINGTIGIILTIALIGWAIGVVMLVYQLYLRRLFVGG